MSVPYEGPRVVAATGTYERRTIEDFGDCIVTGADGHVVLELQEGGRARLDPKSHACVLDADANTLILVAGSASAQMDASARYVSVTLATNHGSVVLPAGGEAWASQQNTLSGARADVLASQAYIAMLGGSGLMSRRTALFREEEWKVLRFPCALGFGVPLVEPAPHTLDEVRAAEAKAREQRSPRALVDSAEAGLADALVQIEALNETTRREVPPELARDDPETYKQRFKKVAERAYWVRTKAALAFEMSVIEVLSGCAARGESESDCAALATWRQNHMPRVKSLMFVESRDRRATQMQN
jgi:hypothetical protein